MSKIWRRIYKIRGKYQNIKPPFLIKEEQYITNKNEVAELMACHYATISSNNSYNVNFQRTLQKTEIQLNFNTNEDYTYNSVITELEFKRMLSLSQTIVLQEKIKSHTI